MAGAKHPNVIVVFADQMRGQATGYAGDPCLQSTEANDRIRLLKKPIPLKILLETVRSLMKA